MCAQEGRRKCARLLVRAGAKLEARTATGATALFIAARQDHADLVSLLLKAGAAADAALPSTGATPLMIGAHLGHAGVCEALLMVGCDPLTRSLARSP